MWIYVISSFTRYSKVGRKARQSFYANLQKDGFYQLHENLFMRHCQSKGNAKMHKSRVMSFLPTENCDITIIMAGDANDDYVFHSLKRKRKSKGNYCMPALVEFL